MSEILFARLDEVVSLTNLNTEITNRIAGDALALQKASNFSDLGNVDTAVANIGLRGKPYVILATGQSNFNNAPAFANTPNSKLLVWNFSGTDGNVGTAFAAASTTTMNVVDRYASVVADADPTRYVYVIRVAFASQDISHWLAGAAAPDVYQNILNQITPALAAIGVSKIDEFLFWQGETRTASPDAYVANFATMIARFYTNTWFPAETPITIFGVAPTTISGDAQSDKQNLRLMTIAAADPDRRKFFYTGVLTGASWADTLHLTGQGYYSAGAMAARLSLQGRGRGLYNGVTVAPVTGFMNIGGYGIPDSLLTVNANTGVSPVAVVAGTLLHLISADTVNAVASLETYGSAGVVIQSRVAAGTQAAPTPAPTDINLLRFAAQGYNGTTFATGAALNMTAIGLWSGANQGMLVDIITTPSGSVTSATSTRFQGSGGVSIGTITDPGIGALLASTSVKSLSPTAGIGYATGAGGSVVQATSKATGVTLNNVSGQITMNAASLAAGTNVTFTLTNSAIGANDTVTVHVKSGAATPGTYITWVDSIAAGSVVIGVRNFTAGPLLEALVLGFNVTKGSIT